MPEISTENSAGALSLNDGGVKPLGDVVVALQHGDQARAGDDLPRAFAFYARATELDSQRVEGWLGRGATAPTVDEAVRSWARALLLSPTNAQATAGLQQRVGEWIAQSAPQDASSLFEVGRTLVEAGQVDLARQLLRRSTELDNTSEDAWIWRASVAEDSAEAVTCLNQARAWNNASKDVQAGLLGLGAPEQDSTAPAGADDIAEAARLVEQARALAQHRDRDGAHRLFQRATELDHRNEEAWLWRGSTTSNVDEALACIERALDINPQNESAREARSWLRVKKVQARIDTAPSNTVLAQPAATSDSPARRSVASTLFLLVTPILVIVISLAVLVWKLF